MLWRLPVLKGLIGEFLNFLVFGMIGLYLCEVLILGKICL